MINRDKKKNPTVKNERECFKKNRNQNPHNVKKTKNLLSKTKTGCYENGTSLAPMAHTCNPSYLGGCNQKDKGSRLA
jgi:hypothetical protein